MNATGRILLRHGEAIVAWKRAWNRLEERQRSTNDEQDVR